MTFCRFDYSKLDFIAAAKNYVTTIQTCDRLWSELKPVICLFVDVSDDSDMT